MNDLAKFDAAINRNRLVQPHTQDQAWTNGKTNDGRPIQYGLGWFVQHSGRYRIIWHYGQWPVFSGLIIKIPDERLTLIMLANSNGLSAPFRLSEDGDVRTSAFALAFLRLFVEENSAGRKLPTPDWRSDSARFMAQADRWTVRYRYSFRDEVKAHSAIQLYLQKAAGL